ncbi:hypothetical protein AJ79_05844 [Helicocarpus griseus UAMH5409]|uniref:Uncharacterized protein n=1 Tax=Helicocarpus griseus UAMH5409 TaxID=1447875 RepID=A0A2B7XIT7_9EURO|nr:hypothetical protein AJ79_05844 [Helicocarpus griseus UAMH5409]
MLFDLKSTIFYGFLVISHASPNSFLAPGEPSKRASLDDFICPDGATISEQDVQAALNECRAHDEKAAGGIYPSPFENNKGNGNDKVFSTVPSGTKLREFPIQIGEPSKYKKRPNSCPAKKKATPGTKNKAITTRSEKELATRGNKKRKDKPIGKAKCSDTTVSEAKIRAALAIMKDLIRNNRIVGKYPERFNNHGRTMDTNIQELWEYPLHHERPNVWNGDSETERFRIVTDKNGKFVGVIEHKGGGGAFKECEVIVEEQQPAQQGESSNC